MRSLTINGPRGMNALRLCAALPVCGVADIAYAQQAPADPNSMSALWIITLAVICLVVLFFGIASLVSRKRSRPGGTKSGPHTPAEAVAGVATYEKARSVAKQAKDASEAREAGERTLGDNG